MFRPGASSWRCCTFLIWGPRYTVIDGVRPTDEIEAMLAIQMVATYEVAMEMLTRAKQSEFMPQLQECGSLAVKLLRTYAAQALICHPTTTVHSGHTEEARREIGITPSLIRMSIGIEHPDDLIADISQAFA